MIANYIPLEAPASGPNFYSFDDSALYEIKVDQERRRQGGRRVPVHASRPTRNPNTFLYNTGPIGSLTDTNWNRPQTYDVTFVHYKKDGRVEQGGKDKPVLLGRDISTPPDNIGPRSTPNYNTLAGSAVKALPGGIKVFAGQRDDPFYVDLGSIFDLAGLASVQSVPPDSAPCGPGVDALAELQHALDRDPGADLATRPGSRTRTSGSTRRRAGRRRPSFATTARKDGYGQVGAGLTPRQPADQRGGDPARQQGLLEPLRSVGRLPVRALLLEARGLGAREPSLRERELERRRSSRSTRPVAPTST